MKIIIYKCLVVLFIVTVTHASYCNNVKLTEEECISFGKKIEAEFNNNHPEVLSQSFDYFELFKIINDGIPDSFKMPINEPSLELYKKRFRFGEEVHEKVENGGFYNFVKYYSEAESHHVVFRLFQEDSGLNYHDFELIKKDGEIKIIDCFILATGEKISSTVRNLFLQYITSQDLDTSAFSDLKVLSKLNELIDAKKFEEALAVYNSTTAKFKEGKVGDLYKITIYMNLDQKDYIKFIDEYEAKHPANPSLYLILIDGYFLRQNYDKVLQCIEKLENQYGPDFILDCYKANMYFHKAEYKTAALYYEKVLTANDSFKTAYESWLIASLEENDFTQAYILSKIVNTRFNITKEDLKLTFNNYPDFKKSQEYKRLKKELK